MKLLKNKLAVTVIVLSVTFLVLIGYSASRESGTMVESGVGSTINYIQGFFYNIGNRAKNSVSFIANFSDVKSENEKLKEQNSNLKSKSIKYDDLLKENTRLRSMLNFKKEKEEFKFIGADVRGKSGGQWTNGLIINKGSNDGLVKGLIAVTNDGLVGRVEVVKKTYSIIETLSNENIVVQGSVSVNIENPKQEEEPKETEKTEDKGKNDKSEEEKKVEEKPTTENYVGLLKAMKEDGNNYVIKLTALPINSKVAKGNIVVTSSSSNVYPKNIKIGEVTKVEEDKVKLMKKAVIKPYVDFDNLEEVLIVVPKDGIPDSLEVQY